MRKRPLGPPLVPRAAVSVARADWTWPTSLAFSGVYGTAAAGEISQAISIKSEPALTQSCRNAKGCDGTAQLRRDGQHFKYECAKCGFVEWRDN
jgi:hypothetical protein